MERLNFFNPFKDKEVTHEDVLTRNFLILLKNVPAAQVAFFELIRETMPGIGLESIALGKLSVSEVYTQVASGGRLDAIQDHSILSVYISDDKFETEHKVSKSDRNARYDGVIVCEPSWMFIIENKPYVGNAWENQLNPNKDDVSGNTLIEQPCCLSWRDIIDTLSAVLEHNVVNDLEKTIIDDFMEYINEAYSWLNPYSRLALCKGNKWLLDKRCGAVLQQCFEGKELKYHRGWKYYIDTSAEDDVVRQIALDTDGRDVTLWMYGGDSMNSAKAMHNSIQVPKLQDILNRGFDAWPNFHIAFSSTNLVWLPSNVDIVTYIQFWKDTKIEQVKRENIEDYCKNLATQGIVVYDEELLYDKIISKQYNKGMNICPGLFMGYKWSIEEAIKLDNQGKFVEECREKIESIRSVYR